MGDTLASLLAAVEEATLKSTEAKRVEREARSIACAAENALTKAEKAVVDFLIETRPRLADEISKRVKLNR